MSASLWSLNFVCRKSRESLLLMSNKKARTKKIGSYRRYLSDLKYYYMTICNYSCYIQPLLFGEVRTIVRRAMHYRSSQNRRTEMNILQTRTETHHFLSRDSSIPMPGTMYESSPSIFPHYLVDMYPLKIQDVFG